ncbi:MAG TPA: hypothetical protein VNM36_03950 [Gemmatimonadaceae bacterium]|nr:hypothetical protein [Gemmatimonadaceae bacterium]
MPALGMFAGAGGLSLGVAAASASRIVRARSDRLRHAAREPSLTLSCQASRSHRGQEVTVM